MKENICGEIKKLHYDGKVKKLNLELVKYYGEQYEIHFQNWTQKDRSTTILKLHIKEAIDLKGMIDKLILEALTDFITTKKQGGKE